MIIRRILSIYLLVSLAWSFSPGASTRASSLFQGNDAEVNARQKLAEMTTEERVGQLFLVTFTGSNADQTSQIYDLITNYHVGGVVLQASNDNFMAAPDTVSGAYQVITQLQSVEWQASQGLPAVEDTGTPTLAPTPTSTPVNYIPLFIKSGISFVVLCLDYKSIFTTVYTYSGNISCLMIGIIKDDI